MTTTAGALRPAPGVGQWRTPLIIIVCGCAIALLSFGPRSSLGFFVQPMSREFSWGRDVFGLALAAQNLLWGLGQPLAGAGPSRYRIADPIRARSSAVEHYLDTVGVTGSIPVAPTILHCNLSAASLRVRVIRPSHNL